jgi:hypothetical protein
MNCLEYLKLDSQVIAAQEKLNRLQIAGLKNNRWGECRRFAGRAAGNHLEKIDAAFRRLHRALAAAEKRYKKSLNKKEIEK